MTTIKIISHDSIHFKIDTDPGTMMEICDHFSFDAPGAKFHPLYRSRMWDGKIRLVSAFTKELYVGLKGYLEHFAKERDYIVDTSEYTKVADPVTLEDVTAFIESLNVSLPEDGKARDYQIDAVYKAISDGRRLLLSPTGNLS